MQMNDEKNELAMVGSQTGEIVTAEQMRKIWEVAPENQREDPYAAKRFETASKLVITKEQQEILSAKPSAEEIQYDKDRNLYYLGHAVIRTRLNKAFGIGQWSMVPV